MTASSLRLAYVLVFLHVNLRRVICSSATLRPDDMWVTAQAYLMLEQARGMELPIRYLVRDLDFKYSKNFDQAFANHGVSIEPTAAKAPNQNPFAERWIGSLKYECLNRFICFGLGHLNHIVSSYSDYYHHVRPHQRNDNKPLLGVWPEVDDPPDKHDKIVCREWLGGLLKHYAIKQPDLLANYRHRKIASRFLDAAPNCIRAMIWDNRIATNHFPKSELT